MGWFFDNVSVITVVCAVAIATFFAGIFVGGALSAFKDADCCADDFSGCHQVEYRDDAV